jgi:transcriptional regulator with XRE-family HTH domain
MSDTHTVGDDLGKRIAAARAYAGISLETLADGISLTPYAIQRIEAGIETLSQGDRRSLVKSVAASTRLPEQFFTVDYAELAAEKAPEDELARLEGKIDTALERMDRVVEEAEGQMTRGKKQLDRFIEVQQPERDLLRRIAEHLGVEPESSP